MWSRRNFLRASAASGIAVYAPLVFSKANFGSVDTIILGGTYHTMDTNLPSIQALAISGQQIIAVGSINDIKSLASKSTTIIDAHGMTVTPGFIDSHSHPLFVNVATSANVGFQTIPEVQASLRERAKMTPKGHWVIGTMYDDTKFKEGRPVLRTDLDEVSMDHPIFIQHRGGHTGVINSKAFDISKITMDSPDPEGGKFYRHDGKFSGRIAEKAIKRMSNLSLNVWRQVA
jgi:predicted amidohydrolase YtcJ